MTFRTILRTLVALALLATVTLGGAPAQNSSEEIRMNLIPQPKKVTPAQGRFKITPEARIFLPAGCERPEFIAAQQLQATLHRRAGVTPTLDRLGLQPFDGQTIALTVAADESDSPTARQGYRLEISPKSVTIAGRSGEGLFNGIKTLTQIVEQFGGDIPALVIQDEPDFAHRGFYEDISRGKVPKMETLKWLVDYLADRKVNQLQLYVEHPFMFRFNPRIAQNPDGMTPQEILELGEYCEDRRIDFVPSLQSFGHMAGVLSLPEYKHLADVELPAEFHDLTWHQRMKGATINMSDPEALALLEKMHDEYLPLFDSKFVNVCADETYDLGKGKNKELAEATETGRLYLQHIGWLNELSKKYGKQMMFWGDIVKQHPHLVPEIPKDTILLDWGYGANLNYEGTKVFADAGLQFYVCPGTSGWNRVINNIDNADLNIRRYAATGKKYGAIGLLNTDWGDYGHFNLISGSLHGIALGAAMAWNTDAPDQEGFDRTWTAQTFGVDNTDAIRNLRTQSVGTSTWIILQLPFSDYEAFQRYKTTTADAAVLIREGEAGAAIFDDYLNRGIGDRWIAEEYAFGSRTNVLVGEKILLWDELRKNNESKNPQLAARLEKFAGDLEEIYPPYQALWRAKNKEAELADNGARITAIAAEARKLATGLK